jgi:TPR repeat protein
LKLYALAGERQDSDAINSMGLMMESGYDDVPPNLIRAYECYMRAHELGSSDATMNLGLLFQSPYFE